MTDTRKLEISLLTMRLSVGVFFLVWAIQKTVAPELANTTRSGLSIGGAAGISQRLRRRRVAVP